MSLNSMRTRFPAKTAGPKGRGRFLGIFTVAEWGTTGPIDIAQQGDWAILRVSDTATTGTTAKGDAMWAFTFDPVGNTAKPWLADPDNAWMATTIWISAQAGSGTTYYATGLSAPVAGDYECNAFIAGVSNGGGGTAVNFGGTVGSAAPSTFGQHNPGGGAAFQGDSGLLSPTQLAGVAAGTAFQMYVANGIVSGISQVTGAVMFRPKRV